MNANDESSAAQRARLAWEHGAWWTTKREASPDVLCTGWPLCQARFASLAELAAHRCEHSYHHLHDTDGVA